MVRLTREIRFTIAQPPSEVQAPLNGLSGNLCEGAGVYLVLQVTLGGDIDPRSSYIQNIKAIDERVRRDAVPAIARLMRESPFTPAVAVQQAARALRDGWGSARLDGLRLYLNPWLSCAVRGEEINMVHLTQRFEFSAAHRLDNPALDEATNQELFGKCNNPAGHGHNYEFEVTLAGEPDATGRVFPVEQFTRIVNERVVGRFDHKYLNVQTEEFAQTVPSVENIARVIYGLLEGQFREHARLQLVRVWETGKTWAEYARG